MIPADPASLPISFAGAVTTAITSVETTVHPAGIQSRIVASSNDPSQAGFIQSSAGLQCMNTPGTPFYGIANSTSSADANEVQNAAPTALSSELPDTGVNVAADTGSNAVPSLAEDEVANAVQNIAVSADSSALPEAAQGPVLRAALSASTSAILASTATARELHSAALQPSRPETKFCGQRLGPEIAPGRPPLLASGLRPPPPPFLDQGTPTCRNALFWAKAELFRQGPQDPPRRPRRSEDQRHRSASRADLCSD